MSASASRRDMPSRPLLSSIDAAERSPAIGSGEPGEQQQQQQQQQEYSVEEPTLENRRRTAAPMMAGAHFAPHRSSSDVSEVLSQKKRRSSRDSTPSSSSITSSAYLYAIQRDLKEIVQLQQQQLRGGVEVVHPPLSTPSQPTSGPTVVVHNVQSDMQLRSIDAVKQAFLHDTAYLLPPPPMQQIASASPPTGLLGSSVVLGSPSAAAEAVPHDISNTSLLPRQELDGDVQRASRSAQISALPPPPPSSSPIPASLVEYHAYLMQLEHQQRQHYEVLRRQRRLTRRQAKEEATAAVQQQQQQQHARQRASPSKRTTTTTGELGGTAAVSATPPRQRIGAPSAGADTAVPQNRRDRSPPLALMMRAMREKAGPYMAGVAEHRTHHEWDSTFTDDDDGEEEEEEVESSTSSRGNVRVTAAKTPPPPQQQPQQRSKPRRTNKTPGKGRRTTPQRATAEVAATHTDQRGAGCGSSGQPQWPSTSERQSSSSRLRPRHATPQDERMGSSRVRSSAAGAALPQTSAQGTKDSGARGASRGRRERQRQPEQQLLQPPLSPPRRFTSAQHRPMPKEQTPPRPILALPVTQKREEEGTLNSDDIAVHLANVSPIKRTTPSLLEHELGGLSLLNHSNDTHQRTGSQSSSAAAATATATAAAAATSMATAMGATTSSSSPVEAFADALLLDTSGTTAGAGNNGGVRSAAATLASVPPSSMLPHAQLRLLANRSAPTVGTATTTTTMVGGTAVLHEPIAFSISQAGLMIPAIHDQDSAEYHYQQQRQWHGAVAQHPSANASSVTPSTSQSPDRPVHAADVAAMRRRVHSIPPSRFQTGATSCQATFEQHTPENPPLGEALSFTPSPGRHTSRGGRHRHHTHYHHQHRRSYEGVSSMIPEHGTGTPRSSRYRDHSTGTGGEGGGSRPLRRQQAALRNWSARVAGDVADSNESKSRRVKDRDGPTAKEHEREKAEAEAKEIALQQQQHQHQQHARWRHVPRHSNGAAHNRMVIVTDERPRQALPHASKDAVTGEEKGQLKGRRGTASASPVQRAVSRGNQKNRNGTNNAAFTQVSPPSRLNTLEKDTKAQAAGENVGDGARATSPTSSRPHFHPYHRLPPTPSAASVWQDVRRMWAPGPAAPAPFATTYRYHPRALSAAVQNGASVLHPLHASTHVDPQGARSRGAPTGTSAAANAAAALVKNVSKGNEGGSREASTQVSASASAAVAAAAVVLAHTPPAATAAADSPSASSPAPPQSPPPPPPPPAPPSRASHPTQMRRLKSHVPRSSAVKALAPLMCMTDSLIGAALQDVLPVCRARQREVAREVDRRRYQLANTSSIV